MTNNAKPGLRVAIPSFVEGSADGTSQGKTTFMSRVRDYVEELGLPVRMIRIESRGVAKSQLREGDVLIATESFAEARRHVGGVAGVVQPIYDAVKWAADNKGVVVIDWGGGLARLRLEIYIMTRFDQALARRGMKGATFFPVCQTADRMSETAKNITQSAEAVPGLRRVLVLNERLGPFQFAPGTGLERAFTDLMAAPRDALVRMEEIKNEAWAICESAGLHMAKVVGMQAPELAECIRDTDFMAEAVLSEIGTWWLSTRQGLNDVFRKQQTSAKAAG